MKKVLFVTTFFFPQNRVPVLRVGQWVKYLAKNDYDVIVLTTKKYNFVGPFGLNENLPDNVEVMEVDFLPRFLNRLLDKRTRNGNIHFKVEREEGAPGNYDLKLFVRRLRNYIGSLFDIHDLWIAPAFREGIKILEKHKIDCIISSYSPPAVHIVAHKLKKRYPNIQWIADFRDLWAYNHISSAKGILGVYEKYRERKVLENVDKIITVSRPLTEIMKEKYPYKKIYTIENGFDPEEFPDWKKYMKPYPEVKGKLTISYFGTIYPGKQDPSSLFEACNELIEEGVIRSNQVEINFYGDNKKQLASIITFNNYNRFNIVSFIHRN